MPDGECLFGIRYHCWVHSDQKYTKKMQFWEVALFALKAKNQCFLNIFKWNIFEKACRVKRKLKENIAFSLYIHKSTALFFHFFVEHYVAVCLLRTSV